MVPLLSSVVPDGLVEEFEVAVEDGAVDVEVAPSPVEVTEVVEVAEVADVLSGPFCSPSPQAKAEAQKSATKTLGSDREVRTGSFTEE